MSVTLNSVPAPALPDLPTGLLIAGKWLESSTGNRIDVINPATYERITDIADASVDDGVAALDAAVAAADAWAATPPRRRGDILRRAFDLLQARREDFASVITTEMGKPYAESLGEVAYGAEFLRWFSEEAVRISGTYGQTPEGTGTMVVSQRPVGPCYLITPWNFPLAMATRKIAPALAAGCTVVIKPATQTPLTTLLFAQLLIEAGVPAGVVNVITTSSSARVSERIIADPRLRKLSFTGSTYVGQQLMSQASRNVLRTSMELGGNAPFIVFEDADIDAAVAGALQAKFRNVGQACTAANRFIVHHSVAKEFSRKVAEHVSNFNVGDGFSPDVAIGPLIDHKAVDSIDSLVQDAIKRGAQIAAGGERIEGTGSFYQPTVLHDVTPDAAILEEEIFGPVLAVVTFDKEEEAVALANSTQYGLAGYVYTRDLGRAQRMIDRIETGMMGLNCGVISNAAAPFGGIKHSGLGREGGREGIAEYLSTKYTLIPTQ